MSSLGIGDGVVDVTDLDTPFGKASLGPLGVFGGAPAFLIWHGYYFSRLVSPTNMLLNVMYKFKSLLFGRDISRF